jgi:hypothetical protein
LADAVLTESGLGRAVSGTILARSLYETAATLSYIDDFMDRTCKSDDPSNANETVMKLLMGSRLEDWEYRSINVVTMIEKVERQSPGAKQLYDNMSEVAHPNWQGTALAFSQTDRGNILTRLGNYPRGTDKPLSSSLIFLNFALIMLHIHHEGFAAQLAEFASFCQRHFEDKHAIRDSAP